MINSFNWLQAQIKLIWSELRNLKKDGEGEKSGIKGIATQTNAPTVYTPETYPNGLFESYKVNLPLTLPNSWGSAVTQAELDANFVYFDVTNGSVDKVLSKKGEKNNKEYFLPSAYVTNYYKELNGAFLSIDVVGDIRKYGQLYLNRFENNSGGLRLYIKNTAGNIVILNSPTSAFTDIQQITLYDIYDGTFLYPLIKMTIDGSKLHDGYFDYGTDLPLNLQPVRFKDASEYFKLYKNNLGKLAYLNSGVQVLGLSTRNYTVKNAEDVGILPTNTASQNSTAINAAISGGNVLLKMNKAGVYLIGNPIEIESNTSIFNTEGVIYKKTIGDYAFVNKGARNRTINSNIHFHNLEIDCDAKTSFISGIDNVNLCTYGLRGSVSFFGVNTLRMTGYFRMYNEHDVACHLANWHDVAMENVFIESLSDAVHINDGSKFRGKNFDIRSDDDAIPLNAMDWINSSPSFGDISDIVVENFQDADSGLSGLGGQTMRNLVGAWIDYYPGVSVMIGDVVTHNGINYRVLANLGTPEAVSTVEPTLTTDGVQADGNFFWKYAGISDGKYQANVYDVLINGLKSYTEDRHICRFDAERYIGLDYGRAIHPDVLPANLPFVKNVNFMNVWKDTYGHFIYAESDMTGIKYEYRIIGAKGFKQKYFDNPYQSDGSVIEIYDCDMTGNNEFLATGINTTAVVLNALNGFGYLRNIDIGGKLITDANVENLPTAKVEDSICYYNNEAYIVYRGNWEKI